MAGQLLSTVQIIFILLSIIGIIGGFYKVITDKAKLEQDLRNEIKNIEEEQKDMRNDYDKLMSKFEILTNQLTGVLDHGRRVTGLENMFQKIDGKMDEFNKSLNSMERSFNQKLGELNISVAMKADKKFT
jgi:peptidoglycan hydrolase CwlO-like protein